MNSKQNQGEISPVRMRLDVKELPVSVKSDWSTEVYFSDVVQKIVQLKKSVDVALHGEGPMPKDFSKNWPQEWKSQSKTVDPDAFMRRVFPFIDNGPWGSLLKTPGPLVAYVDPHLVIGASWRHWPTSLSAHDKAQFVEETDEQVRRCIVDGEWRPHLCGAPAEFAELSPFGLYVADEGKNRIAVYQELNRLVGANIYVRYHYPAPERLRLKKDADGRISLILDGHFEHPLAYAPELLEELFQRYGVPFL